MKKLLAALLICLALPAQAQQSKQDIIGDINSLFPDNSQNLITAADLRFVTTVIVSSYVDFITCSASGGLVFWTTTASPVASPTCLPKGTQGQFLQSGAVTPSWTNLSSGLTAGTSIGITGTITPTISVSDSNLNGLSTLATNGYVVRQTSAISPFITRSISGVAGQVVTTNNDGTGGNTTIGLVPLSNLLDGLGSAVGDIIYRSTAGWVVLTPNVSGQVLANGGSGNPVSWVTVAGTGTLTNLLCGLGLTCNPNPITTTGTITPTLATNSQVWSATPYPLIDSQELNALGNPVTYGMTSSSIGLDFTQGVDFNITLAASPTFVNPTITTSLTGRTGCIWITQPSTTTYQPASFGTSWKFAGGVSPTFTISAGATDLLCYKVKTTSFVAAILNANFK